MPICDLNPGSTAVLLFLISGLIGTLAYKLMGSQTVSEGGHERPFYHPYMEAMTMSIGELICLILYYSNQQKYKLPLEDGKTPHKFYYFLVPGFWDITLSVMQYMALSFISGSTYKILQGGAIVTTLVFSRILLKIVIEKRHVIGCSLGIVGLVIIGLSSFINSSSTS
jgi:drug/metabolite transporter (DMT)-like permease